MTIVTRRKKKPVLRARFLERGAFIYLIWSRFRRRWQRGRLRFCNVADNTYYLPSQRQVEQVLKEYRKRKRSYATERFDCDDFAWTLKSTFCDLAARRPGTPAGYAVGVIWTESDPSRGVEGHAYNWVVTDQKEIWMIEPQNGAVWRLGEPHRAIGADPEPNYDNNICLVCG